MSFPNLILPIVAERPDQAAGAERDSNRLTYWEYIRLDDLLALARPQTGLRDERVFIMFHQMAEMILALIINELEQLTAPTPAPVPEWKTRLTRIVSICGLFIHNINALGRSIDREQFLHFREALSPASGFQSFQYRKMELLSARLGHLARSEQGGRLPEGTAMDILFERLYWRHAIPVSRPASERTSLIDFEARYLQELRIIAMELEHRNLAAGFAALAHEHRTDENLMGLMREFDRMVNEGWREVHLRLALTLLDGNGAPRPSTGGTDWKAYLRETHRVTFFPELSEPGD